MMLMQLVPLLGFFLSITPALSNDNYFPGASAIAYGQNPNVYNTGQNAFSPSSVSAGLSGASTGGRGSSGKPTIYGDQSKPSIDSNKSLNALPGNNPLDPYRSGSQSADYNAPPPANPYQYGVSRPSPLTSATIPEPQGSSYNQNNLYTPSYDYRQPNPFRPVERPDQNKPYNSDPKYGHILTNTYIPPTTYRGDEGSAARDSFFDVTNPLSNKKDVISTYQPQNNFVNPSHFIIPSKDKYDMVSNIFGGLGQRNKDGSPSKTFGQQGLSLSLSPGYKSIDDGLQNLGQNYDSSDKDKPVYFNLGFFKDDPYQAPNAKATPNAYDADNKSGLKKITNPYGQPNVQAKPPSIYGAPNNAGDVYKESAVNNKQTSYISAPYQNGFQTSDRTGQAYQDNKAYSDKGRQDFKNAYDTKSYAGNTAVSHNQGKDILSSVSPQHQANTGVLNNGYQNNNLFNAPPPAAIGPPPLSGSNVFNNQLPTPLFSGFTKNKRLSLDDFRSKNLLGDQDFGQTPYDQTRPTSASILGSDLYRQMNFGKNNLLGSAQTQGGQYNKGGSGFNQVFGKTKTVGDGYDNVNSKSQGYSKSFDDNNVIAAGSNNFGGFNAHDSNNAFGGGKSVDNRNQFGGGVGGNKAGYADQGGFKNSYQSSDSFKDGGGYRDGNSYSGNYGYSDGKTVGNQYSNNDHNQQDYKNGYAKQQQGGDQKSFSNSDTYNDAYANGKKYDLTDGYTDKINYNNKDSDASHAQYSTNDGYKEGVANVGSTLSGRSANPYAGVNSAVNQGLGADAKYKPFNVNGPVFNGEFL